MCWHLVAQIMPHRWSRVVWGGMVRYHGKCHGCRAGWRFAAIFSNLPPWHWVQVTLLSNKKASQRVIDWSLHKTLQQISSGLSLLIHKVPCPRDVGYLWFSNPTASNTFILRKSLDGGQRCMLKEVPLAEGGKPKWPSVKNQWVTYFCNVQSKS